MNNFILKAVWNISWRSQPSVRVNVFFFLIWADAFILEIMLDSFSIVGDKIITFGILTDKTLKG